MRLSHFHVLRGRLERTPTVCLCSLAAVRDAVRTEDAEGEKRGSCSHQAVAAATRDADACTYRRVCLRLPTHLPTYRLPALPAHVSTSPYAYKPYPHPAAYLPAYLPPAKSPPRS
jgi:hypothetical protein